MSLRVLEAPKQRGTRLDRHRRFEVSRGRRSTERTVVSPTTNPPRLRRLAVNLGLLAVVLAVSLGVGEVLARILFKNTVLFPRYHNAVQYGPYTLRRIQPNTTFWHTSPDGFWEFRINAQGFRDDQDYVHAKPPGTVRILVLGDSHTAGFEVDQEATFPEVVERYLRLSGMPAEVLNTGISGFGTAEQLAFLEAEGVRYEPDVIVLGFFANDYEDAVRSKLFAVDDGRLVGRSRSYAPATSVLQVLNAVPLLKWLSENSHLYSVAMNTVWMLARAAVAAAAKEDLEAEYAVPAEALTDYRGELVVRLVERMYVAAQQIGARLIIVDIPARRRWAGDAPEATDYDRGAANFVSSVPSTLRPAFDTNSDRFITSEDVFAEFRGIIPLHRPHGHAHITEFTHALLGVAVARAILCEQDPIDRPTGGAPGANDVDRTSLSSECRRGPGQAEGTLGAGGRSSAAQQGTATFLTEGHRSIGHGSTQSRD